MTCCWHYRRASLPFRPPLATGQGWTMSGVIIPWIIPLFAVIQSPLYAHPLPTTCQSSQYLISPSVATTLNFRAADWPTINTTLTQQLEADSPAVHIKSKEEFDHKVDEVVRI